MERVVAGACRGCAARGGLLRGKPSASPANGEAASSRNSIDDPGSGDSCGYLGFGSRFGSFFGPHFGSCFGPSATGSEVC